MNFWSLFGVRKPAPTDRRQVLVEKIRKRTGDRVRNLRVETGHGRVVVFGEVPSQYVRQLALVAAASGAGGLGRLEMHVEVESKTQADDAGVAASDMSWKRAANRNRGSMTRTRGERKR